MNSVRQPGYIVALGASTPIGRDAWSSAAAVRAGIAGVKDHPFVNDSINEPVKVAAAPWLDFELTGAERLQALLFPAIDQVMETVETYISSRRVVLALALPAPRPGLGAETSKTMAAALAARYPGAFRASAVFPNGHAAGLLALDAASRKLASGDIDACVIAGVDSYMDPETLEWLEECDQLHSAGALNNAWGFMPGEAAGALLVVSAALADQFRDILLAQVLGVGTAIEPNRIKTETVCVGAGLTQAFRDALASLPAGEKISDVYCDLNGEPYRAEEYGYSCVRIGERFDSPADFVAPADCWGDVSAAGVPLQIALAAIAGSKGYSNGATSFVWASSENGERAAAVLRVRNGGRRGR